MDLSVLPGFYSSDFSAFLHLYFHVELQKEKKLNQSKAELWTIFCLFVFLMTKSEAFELVHVNHIFINNKRKGVDLSVKFSIIIIVISIKEASACVV